MATIKLVDVEGKELVEEQSENTINEGPGVIAHEDFFEERIGAMFDLGMNDVDKFRGKLKTLIEYAKAKTDDHSVEGIKWALRSLGTKLGTPPLGEKLINYMHTYAKLHLHGKHIEEQKQRFLRGEKDEY